MFKKCIATYLSILFVLLPFCTALAAGGNTKAVIDEQKLLEALIANAPFDIAAFKTMQIDKQRLAEDIVQSAQQLLGLLASHDEEFSLLINKVCESKLINKPAAEIKFMILNGLQEMADAPIEVTPGCLTSYTFSALAFFFLTPFSFIFFIENLVYNPDEPNCAIMYGNWWLASLFLSLAIRQTYLICTEESKPNPDPAVIAKYDSDRTTMQVLSLIFFVLGSYTATMCPNKPFNVFGNR